MRRVAVRPSEVTRRIECDPADRRKPTIGVARTGRPSMITFDQGVLRMVAIPLAPSRRGAGRSGATAVVDGAGAFVGVAGSGVAAVVLGSGSGVAIVLGS